MIGLKFGPSFRVIAAVIAVLLLVDTVFLRWNILTNGLHASANSMGFSLPDRFHSTGTPAKEAGNSTLGFSSIFYLNLKTRYDRTDAISLQAFLSGVRVTEYPAVEKDTITDVGLPPTSSQGSLTNGQIGCWRAHANIWAKMLRENLPPVLILESDAAWDVDIRKITPNLNRHFRKLINDIGSHPLPNPSGWSVDESPEAAASTDTWMSNQWDLFSFGHCSGLDHENKATIVYEDQYAPSGQEYHGTTLGHERVIQKQNGIVCTTAYAITQTGAAKLLLKTVTNLDVPVDLAIRSMIDDGELRAYSMYPPVIAQWKYMPKLGMEQRGANSDINEVDSSEESEEEGWAEVRRTGNVWTLWYNPDESFTELALQGAGKRILGYDLPKNE